MTLIYESAVSRAPEDGTKMYSFTAYIDNYDIVAYNDETKDQFPGLDTTKPEESEAYDYTNLQYNEPSGVWKKDTEVHSTGSTYSQKITIEGDYPSIDAKVHLNSANELENCDLTDAVMTFDIKFRRSVYWRDPFCPSTKQIATKAKK